MNESYIRIVLKNNARFSLLNQENVVPLQC